MKTGPTMTKNEQALLFMQTHLELERRVKIMEVEMQMINKKMIDTFPEGLDPVWTSDQQICLEAYHLTNKYCL